MMIDIKNNYKTTSIVTTHDLKVAQKIAGHVNPSTTLIYEDPPEEMIGEALKGL